MDAGRILISVSVILLVATIWEDLTRGSRMTPSKKTYLMIAASFAFINALLQFIN